GEVCGQRVRLVTQVGAGIAGALTKLVPAPEQSLPYRVGVHVNPPGKKWLSSGRSLCATLVLEPLLQLVEGFDEFRDPLALELLGNRVHVDVQSLEALAYVGGLGDMPLEAQLRPAQLAVRVDRLEWHGVDGVGHHQLLDVL